MSFVDRLLADTRAGRDPGRPGRTPAPVPRLDVDVLREVIPSAEGTIVREQVVRSVRDDAGPAGQPGSQPPVTAVAAAVISPDTASLGPGVAPDHEDRLHAGPDPVRSAPMRVTAEPDPPSPDARAAIRTEREPGLVASPAPRPVAAEPEPRVEAWDQPWSPPALARVVEAAADVDRPATTEVARAEPPTHDIVAAPVSRELGNEAEPDPTTTRSAVRSGATEASPALAGLALLDHLDELARPRPRLDVEQVSVSIGSIEVVIDGPDPRPPVARPAAAEPTPARNGVSPSADPDATWRLRRQYVTWPGGW